MGVYTFRVTTDANGAGTATSNHNLFGNVSEVRYGGTSLSGTATYTITRVTDGGTVLSYTATSNPWSRAPRQPAHSQTGGTTAYNTGVGPVLAEIPTDGPVKLVVANGGSVVTDSVQLYTCD